MAKTGRQIGFMPESQAVEIVVGASYSWLIEHGYPTPTLVDVSIRMHEYRHGSPKALGALVLAWSSEHEFDSPEGERRGRVERRAFNKIKARGF